MELQYAVHLRRRAGTHRRVRTVEVHSVEIDLIAIALRKLRVRRPRLRFASGKRDREIASRAVRDEVVIFPTRTDVRLQAADVVEVRSSAIRGHSVTCGTTRDIRSEESSGDRCSTRAFRKQHGHYAQREYSKRQRPTHRTPPGHKLVLRPFHDQLWKSSDLTPATHHAY